MFVVVIICGSVWYFLSSIEFYDYSRSHREPALNKTRQLLAEIVKNPAGPQPDELPGDLRVNEECWTFLQKCMNTNADQYKLYVTDEYNSFNDPRSVHDLVEVWINIDFPNGQRAEMYYSNGGLTGCREK